MSRACFLAFILCLCACVSAVASGHPSQGFERLDVPDSLLKADLPAEAWTELLTFRPCGKPESELTAAERYILFGCRPVHGHQGDPEPWSLKILLHAMTLHGLSGEVPAQLTREMLDLAMANGESMPEAMARWYLSPITGNLPRLDSSDFTPGGVYIRALTLDEIRYLAQWDTTLTGLITTRKMLRSDGSVGEAVLLGKVYYYRFYGETGLLKEGITYAFAPALDD